MVRRNDQICHESLASSVKNDISEKCHSHIYCTTYIQGEIIELPNDGSLFLCIWGLIATMFQEIDSSNSSCESNINKSIRNQNLEATARWNPQA